MKFLNVNLSTDMNWILSRLPSRHYSLSIQKLPESMIYLSILKMQEQRKKLSKFQKNFPSLSKSYGSVIQALKRCPYGGIWIQQ